MFSFIMDKDNNNHDNDYDHTSTLSLTTLSSPPSTPSAVAAEDAVVAGTRLYRARLIVENQLYDQLISRYRLAITRLREVTREANALQEENEWLRLANEDLGRRLVGPAAGDSRSPRSVMMNNNGDYNNDERFTLPKSISVRSPGYFKLMTPPNPPSPSPSPRVNGTKLRVQREEKAVDMEVFNQGMYKTELCNKWQETATCPYGNNCRFAHGISELRPVIRHPRYKTQVCRMVLTGVTCPYGHRCHFRHALAATTTTTTRLSS